MGARGKFGEHENNSSFVNALQTSQVHPYLGGTQREYSSKPLKHIIVNRTLVFKR